MKRLLLVTLALSACNPAAPPERYGFVTRLGRDTISVEQVSRTGDHVVIESVDRFPRVRRRHTEIRLNGDGSVRSLETTITAPSDSAHLRERRVTARVDRNAVHLSRTDGARTSTREIATGGAIAMPHVQQMYSLYELYIAAGLMQMAEAGGDSARLRQFYVDREFDDFPLHRGLVRRLPDGRVEVSHGWLSGTGEAVLDSKRHLLRYSGARTTYLVDVERVASPPDVDSMAARFAAAEAATGGTRALSVRDTARGRIGATELTVDYGRPLARGRTLVGGVIPYDRIWRTGANAATQLTTSGPITLAGMELPAGTYTLWTIPRRTGLELIVNREFGQWGTDYHRDRDLGRAPIAAETITTPVEQFTISIVPAGERGGSLVLAWGPHRWTAPIEVR